MLENARWYVRAKEEADKGVPRNERVFGAFLSIFCLAVLLYLIAHQVAGTGFYTEKFGPVEMVLHYGFWVGWTTTAVLEGVLGLRLASRLFDTFILLPFAPVALVWLLIVFPFSFQHFAAMAPGAFQFLVNWIHDDLVRVVFGLAIILHGLAAVYAPSAYKLVEWKRPRRGAVVDKVSEDAPPPEPSSELPPE